MRRAGTRNSAVQSQETDGEHRHGEGFLDERLPHVPGRISQHQPDRHDDHASHEQEQRQHQER